MALAAALRAGAGARVLGTGETARAMSPLGACEAGGTVGRTPAMPLVRARWAACTECDAGALVGARAAVTLCVVGSAVDKTGAPAMFCGWTARGLVRGAGAMAWLGAWVAGSAGFVRLVGA
jgi:hypothetical protein